MEKYCTQQPMNDFDKLTRHCAPTVCLHQSRKQDSVRIIVFSVRQLGEYPVRIMLGIPDGTSCNTDSGLLAWCAHALTSTKHTLIGWCAISWGVSFGGKLHCWFGSVWFSLVWLGLPSLSQRSHHFMLGEYTSPSLGTTSSSGMGLWLVYSNYITYRLGR